MSLGLYNEDIKMQYLNTLPDNKAKSTIVNSFIRFSNDMEKPLNKDLYEMSKAELTMMLSFLNILSFTDIRIKLSFIIDYIDWAISQNLIYDILNNGRQVDIYSVNLDKAMLKSLFKDEQSLVNAIEVVYDTDVNIIEPIAMMLLWMGITIKDAVNIEESSFNWEDYSFNFNNHQYTIPNEFKKIFIKYKEAITGDLIRESNYKAVRYFADSKYFIKKTITGDIATEKDEQLKHQSLSSNVSRFRNKYIDATGDNIQYSSGKIMLSGELNRMYHDELNGEIINQKYITDKIDNSLSSSLVIDKIELYKQYKRVFWGE